MLLKEPNTRWGIVIAGWLSGLSLSFLPVYAPILPAGYGAILALGVLISLFMMLYFHPIWTGLLVPAMLAVNVSYPEGELESFISHTPLFILFFVYLRSLFLPGNYQPKGRRRYNKWDHIFLIAYLAMTMFSVTLQRTHAEPLFAFFRETLMAVAILVWMYRFKERKQLILDWMLVFSLGLLVVLVYSVFFSPYPGKGGPIPFFPNANYFSALLSIALPFMVWLGWSRRDVWRWIGWGMAASFLFGIIWFQSRGAWVGLAGGLVFFVLYLSRSLGQRLALAGVLVAGVTSILVYTLSPGSFNAEPVEETSTHETGSGHMDQLWSIIDTRENFSNRERIMRWKLAYRLFIDHPLLGVQPRRFQKRFKYKLEDRGEVSLISYWDGWRGGAHSEYMTRMAERGILGTLPFLAYWFMILFTLYRLIQKERLGRIWGACLAFALGTWLTHGIFNDLSTLNAVWIAVMVIAAYIMQMKPEKE